MQIPPLAAIATTTAASQQARPPQKLVKPELSQSTDAVGNTPTASFTAIKNGGVPSSPKLQDGGMGLLNSMIETSLKMQAIHNDASIPPEIKKKLLKPLEQANKQALDLANIKAEQEEKSKILEASSEDARVIREAGEEIAQSAGTKNTPPLESSEPNAPTGSDATVVIPPELHVAAYSTFPSAALLVGDSIDVRA